jgi:hypothetical protein
MNKFKLSVLLSLALPLICLADNNPSADSLTVLAFGRDGNKATMKPMLGNGITNKIYFGSGLGGYSPEKGINDSTGADELQIQLITELRLICSQSVEERETFSSEVLNLIPVDRSLFIDSSVFSETDLHCLHSLSFFKE